MNEDKQEKRKAVKKAFTELAKKRQHWPNKYDINLELSKMLCDYALLSKASLLDKRVLNIGCSEPLDEVFWDNLVQKWHTLDINEAAIDIIGKLTEETLSPKLYSQLSLIRMKNHMM